MVERETIGLADIEGQIDKLQQSIRELAEIGIRTDEALRMPGAQAKKWLIARGYTEQEAGRLIVRVVRERREAAHDAEGADSA